LEESIRNNNDYGILERQLMACRIHLNGRLFLGHAGVCIDQELLDEKEHQIKILKMISTCASTVQDAEELFRHPEELQFLSLANITSLFLQFDDAAAESVFPSFLGLLTDLVKKNPAGIECLARVFEKITQPMNYDSVQNLIAVQKLINDIGGDPNLCLSGAIAIARASENCPDRAVKLAGLHRQLGRIGVCHAQSGLFLEYLLDALLARLDEFESEVTAAFACYFSDLPLAATSHHSQLHFRCSRFVQAFYDHVIRIDDRNAAQNLFPAYFSIWKHWKSGCGCITEIDGWRMYKHVKKHGNQLSKKELPDGFQPSDVLEDLLRNDPIGRMESRIALSKVLIRGYVTASTLKPDKLVEAIELLSHESITDPRFILIQAIARGIQNESPLETLTILSELPEFIEWKPECRRIYWILRILNDLGRRSEATEHARKAIALLAKGVAAEYAFPLVSLAAEILGDVKVL
jgi:hypothetical protein